MSKRTRVLVVEDSLTVRKRLVEIFGADPELEVVGEAEDGKRGIELCQSLRPDVVTLDMIMPHMSGLAATEYIMAYCPTPILIVSASTNRGELLKTYDALAAGAVDVIEKPVGDEGEAAWEQRLRRTVKLVARIKVITHLRGRMPGAAPPLVPAEAPAAVPLRALAMGASTGGPSAVVGVLRGLGPDFPVPILLVIHLGRPFATAFAEWLDEQAPMPVAYAGDGVPLPAPGACRVFLAPPDRHLVLRGGRMHLTDDPERLACRPSVDVLFESVAAELGSAAAGCLLTGMGRDGAEGLLRLRRAGAPTIAQDEATSAVFGMPGEAIRLGAAQQVLPIDRIAGALAALARPRGRR